MRPGSPGRQGLRLTPAPGGWQASFAVPMDSYGRDADRTAGKLLHVQGNWHFEIWAKGTAANQSLRVRFLRVNENTFLDETIPLNLGWQKIERNFFVDAGKDAANPNAANPLFFDLWAIGGNVIVDDVELRRSDYNNPTVFTDNYVNMLQQLRPGILRNWGDQLGSSLDNQLATPFARQTTAYSPRHRAPIQFHYSLHEFLVLSQRVGAEPWYVIPPTWTPAELQNLMAYLAAPAGSHPYANLRQSLGQSAPWTSVFGQIHLEFGNEIWGSNAGGDPFAGASMRGGTNAGTVANARFNVMKGSPWYNAGKFDLIIGGQHRFAPRQTEIENASSAHDSIGFAPYYGELQSFNSEAVKYYPLFGHSWDTVRSGLMVQSQNILKDAGQNTNMAIYEINVHAITGNVPIGLRNQFLAGMGSGVALPLTMLTYQRDMGIRNQAAFQAVQYSTRMADGQFGRVWGLFRDVEATQRIRPTGLGLQLANTAIRGNMITTSQTGGNPAITQQRVNGLTQNVTYPLVQSFAFNQGNRYAVVLFNLSINQGQSVRLQLPRNPQANATMYSLVGNSPNATNEDFNAVTVQTQGINNFTQSYNVQLAPHSMTVIEWTAN